MAPSDVELLQAWRAGQTAAGQLLLERHGPGLRRFLRRRAGDLADDLLQDTLLVGLSQRDGFRGTSSYRTYLFGIAKKLAHRTLQKQKRLVSTESIEDTVPLRSADDFDYGRCRLVLEALQSLHWQDQFLLKQYFWDDLTANDIGRALGVPERTIRSRLHRILARLRTSLTDVNQR